MSLVINSNVTSMNAAVNVARTQRKLATSFEKISSGLRINRAADDAAGLAIAEGLDARGRSAEQAMRNVNDGISAIQVAEGATNEIAEILKRMRELAMQAGNSLLGTADRAFIEDEYDEIRAEITRIANLTEFSGTNLLNASSTIKIQIGVANGVGNTINLQTRDLRASTLAINSLTGLTATATPTDVQAALTKIDAAIASVNSARSVFGSLQNRLGSAMRNLETYRTNTKAAESRIRDVDFAQETANMTKLNIMQQAGVAVLGQANQLPSAAFQLLQ